MTRCLGMSVLLLALLAPSAPARVFWNLGGGTAQGLLDAGEANWNRAYSAPLRINGGRANLSVWGTQQSIEESVSALRQRAGGPCYFAISTELAWGIAFKDGQVLRFVISAGPDRYSHIFQLVQSFDDYRASREAPATAALPNVPEIPEARVSQVLANEETGLTLASAHTALPPAAAQQQVNATLAGAGWHLLMPAGGQAGVYVRGRDLVVTSAVSAGRAGETVLTLAHKRRAVENEP